MLNYLLERIKKSQYQRGRAFLIRSLARFFKDLKCFRLTIENFTYPIVLDLSDDAAIFLYLNDGKIPHENGLLNLFKHFESKDKNFWDIGTNYGFYPWIFLNHNMFNKVYCFEPNIRLVKTLKLTFHNSAEKVLINNCGIGAKSDKLSFKVNPRESDLGSFAKEIDATTSEEVLIDVRTIDSFRQAFGKPDMIKIDVEGFEEEVIRGYENLNVDYPIITIEWIEKFQKSSFKDFLGYFDTTWHFFFIGYDGKLYLEKSNNCSSDIFFISERNSCFNMVEDLLAL
jgi:FkbM family methyltransferase